MKPSIRLDAFAKGRDTYRQLAQDHVDERLTKHQKDEHFGAFESDCSTCKELRNLFHWLATDWVYVTYQCECGNESKKTVQDSAFLPDVFCPICSKRMVRVIVGG